LFNLYVDPSFSGAVGAGGQMRRLDFINPLIHSVVDPEGNHYILPKIDLLVQDVQVTDEEIKDLLGIDDNSTSSESDKDPYTSDIYGTDADSVSDTDGR